MKIVRDTKKNKITDIMYDMRCANKNSMATNERSSTILISEDPKLIRNENV